SSRTPVGVFEGPAHAIGGVVEEADGDGSGVGEGVRAVRQLESEAVTLAAAISRDRSTWKPTRTAGPAQSSPHSSSSLDSSDGNMRQPATRTSAFLTHALVTQLICRALRSPSKFATCGPPGPATPSAERVR